MISPRRTKKQILQGIKDAVTDAEQLEKVELSQAQINLIRRREYYSRRVKPNFTPATPIKSRKQEEWKPNFNDHINRSQNVLPNKKL